MLAISYFLAAMISMSVPSSQDLSSEATRFYEALKSDFDVSRVLNWSYQIDDIPEDQVKGAMDAAEQAGFSSVEVVDGDGETGYAVAFSESRQHDAQSFAARVLVADALARKYGGTLADFSAGP
jgi:hypothetical protein